MNKSFVYLFIFALVISLSKEVLAGTDILCNVLTTINGTLKKVGEVQNKISGKTREIASKKVSSGKMFSSVEKLKEKAKKIREKAENLKEKAEKVKAFAENAKEKKEELTAKYKELNALAEELFTKANEAFAKGESIFAEYEEKFQEYKGEDQVSGVSVNEVASTENSNAEAPSVLTSSVAGSSAMENALTDVRGEQSNTQNATVSVQTKGVSKVDTPEVTNVLRTNQADAISSVTKLADQVASEGQTFVIPSQVNVWEKSEVNVSTKDIMKGVTNLKQQSTVPDKEVKTDVDIKDQLTSNANKSLSLSSDKKVTKATLFESKNQSKVTDNRAKFGVIKAPKKALTISNTTDKMVGNTTKPVATAKPTQLIKKSDANSTKSVVKPNKIMVKETGNVR